MAYTYRGVVNRVVDGDTVDIDIDLGFGIWIHRQSFRLLGINAREHSMSGGPEATANLSALLAVNSEVVVASVKPDKFGGRYDAHVSLPDGRDLSALLVKDGWAAAWSGAGTKPLPPWPRTATTA